MSSFQTYLVKIPQANQKKAEAFEEIFRQLHESIPGKKIALEIAVMGQNIGFCFTADEATCDILSGEIYAMAPEADIVKINDFVGKMESSAQFVSSEITLKRNDLFPIKDYREFSNDSLSGLLNVLSKSVPGEGVWIQIVASAAQDTGLHHLQLNIKRKLDKVAQFFRIKYWFKKEVVKDFGPKIEEKTKSRLFRVSIRVGVYSEDRGKNPMSRMQAVLGTMNNFNTLDLNQVKAGRVQKGQAFLKPFKERTLNKATSFKLSTKELATLYHLPDEGEVPNIIHVLARKGEPPADLPNDRKDPNISFFGLTNFHGKKIPFGIKRDDRRRHLYALGKSGSGKSKMLELLIQNDIREGKGVGVLDPHGDLVDNVLRMIPEDRIKDVIVFDPSDTTHPISFNPLADVPPELKIRVTIGFIEIFKKLFGANWTPRLEHVLRYTTLALLDTPGTTILSILKMLTDKNYRQMIVRNIQDNVVKNFWVNEFAGWSEKFDNEAITPLLNKVGQFVSTNMIRNIVGQPENKIDFREIMDNNKILLMKVSKGILGEENAALMGAIAITKIYQSAMSRADLPEEQRKDWYLYVDEFQNFATDTFDEILSEARKYRLNLTIAHQFLGQLSPKIQTTVFGNVGSMVNFRVGGDDAQVFAKEYNPRFSERDIINLGVREFYAKMSVDGELREAFSGRTLDMKFPKENYAADCIAHSRANYARPDEEVQEILNQWEEGKPYEGEKKKEKGEKRGGSGPDPFETVEFVEPIL